MSAIEQAINDMAYEQYMMNREREVKSMAQKVLIMGESGTGKSASLRNCDPATTAVVNPVGKPLPFKGSGKFEMLNSVTDSRKICKWMKEQAAAGKKLIVVDDFQYMLAVPYMQRIKESGWDKWNDFGANYYDIIEVCKELPDDVIVVYMSHLETLDTGVTTIKLIGKMLREKITIEGLFTIVLRTGCYEAKYYFYTQNSGKDTVKSPMGMFPTYAIDNDLAYVVDKIRNYYEMDGAVSDDEMAAADAAVSADIQKPDSNGRRSRTAKSSAPAQQAAEAVQKPVQATEEPVQRKTHDEVVKANEAKMEAYVDATLKAIDEAAGDREGISLEEAEEAAAAIPVPELEKVPRRTRKERTVQTHMPPEPAPEVLEKDTPFFLPFEGNYVMKHAGDIVPKDAQEITLEEFNRGVAGIARNGQAPAMNPPEEEGAVSAEATTGGMRARRTRRSRTA